MTGRNSQTYTIKNYIQQVLGLLNKELKKFGLTPHSKKQNHMF